MFTIKIADKIIDIYNHYDYIEKLSADYICDKTTELSADCIRDKTTELSADMEISITDEEILDEQSGEITYNKGYLESLAVYRKICDAFIDADTILFHCSAMMIDGKAYLFTGPSGTGKSTHVRMWKERFKNRVTIINDDKPLVHYDDKENVCYVFGTPWCGKHGMSANVKAKVEGIIILHQDNYNHIRRMESMEAYPQILSQIYRPRTDTEKMVKILKVLDSFIKIPIYEMGCTISVEAVEMAYNKFQKDESFVQSDD